MSESSPIDRLRDELAGELVLPEDAQYDEVRAIWNAMIDRRPALIVRCHEADDVVRAVNFARAQNALVSVRCGGHGVAGKAVCDDGVMIDLSPMNAVNVDVDGKIARVEGGARLGNLDAATLPHGLVTTAGLVSETGVGGLTLGGGLGYLARRFGITADNLVAADVVTAAGESVRASAGENPDLFWALRGGGGNFGIVTAFEFRLHEMNPEVLVGQAFHPLGDAPAVLRFYRELMIGAPDELAAYALVANVPPVDPFPEETHGKPSIAVVSCYSGDHDAGRKLLAPIETFGTPILAFVQPMPYVALQQAFNEGMPSGQRYYWKSHFMRALSDDAIAAFVDNVTELPGAFSMAGFEPMGGAINRVASDATAFPHRDAGFALGVWAGWGDTANDQAAIEWARKVHEAMAPYSTGGMYANYLDHDDDGLVANAFADNLKRLEQVKAKYDPGNFFRSNHNIRPGTSDTSG